MMRNLAKLTLLLSVLFLSACGGQQARELSEQWQSAGNASVAFATKMKEADLRQQQALKLAVSQQAQGASIISSYRQQVTARGDVALSTVDADYYRALAEGRALVNQRLESLESEIAEKLESFAEGAIELQQVAEQKESEIVAGDTVSLSDSWEAWAGYYRYLGDYHEERANRLQEGISLVNGVLTDYENELAEVRRTHREEIAALVGEYRSDLDEAASEGADDIDVPSLQPSYEALIAFLNQNASAAQSMHSYHQMFGFGKGSLFSDALTAFGDSAVSGLFADADSLPTFDDLEEAGESIVKDIVNEANASIDDAKREASDAFDQTKSTFTSTLNNKITGIINDIIN
jgi:hypothetical protein